MEIRDLRDPENASAPTVRGEMAHAPARTQPGVEENAYTLVSARPGARATLISVPRRYAAVCTRVESVPVTLLVLVQAE